MNDSHLATLPLFPLPPKTSARLDFYGEVRRFDHFGRASLELVDAGIPYLINEFWTAVQRQSHSLHEISYRGCFKAQLPEFFIARLSEVGEAVYDPFAGRGTTPVQAALMGRRPVANDINPLSAMLTRPRFNPPTLQEVARRLREISWETGEVENLDLLAFYSPRTLRHICALRGWLAHRGSARPLDAVDDWVRMVALNRLTGHSAGFFSVYTMPPNQAVSLSAQRKINEKRGQIPPDRDVSGIILKKSRTLLSDGLPPPVMGDQLLCSTADLTPEIANDSVTLTVTSPPFLDIVQYADDNWLRCWFAGIDVAEVAISHHRLEAGWQEMVRRTLLELARVTRSGGHVAFEVGEVRGGRVLLERLVWAAAEGLPFERLFVMVNQQEFTKTANCWGVGNNAKGTNTNRIVMLRRH